MVCYSRSGDVIEYLMKDQWFVSVREMADDAIEVIVILQHSSWCHLLMFLCYCV